MFAYLAPSLSFVRRGLPAAALALGVAAALPACAAADLGAPDQGGEDLTLEERLARTTTVGVAPSAEGSFARVQAVSLRDGATYEVEVGIRGGAITLSLDGDGQLRLEGLAAQGDDIQMAQTMLPPEGLTLTGIELALAAPASGEVTATGGAMTASAGCELDVHWAVELESGVVDLAPIRLAELPFDLVVSEGADGAVEARLTAEHAGPFWSWAGVFELRDLEIDLVASSEVTATGETLPVD